MSDLKQAAQQALDYIEQVDYGPYDNQPVKQALRAALEAQEQHDTEMIRELDSGDALLEALRVFVSCASPVSTEIDERGYRWIRGYLDQALPIARAAIKQAEGEKR